MAQYQEVRTHRVVNTPFIRSPHAYSQKKAIFRAYQVVWYMLGIIETLLASRFLFKMLAANQGSSFVDFIYTLSYPFASPFLGIFGITAARGAVVEWSTLVGMIVYLIAAWGLVKFMKIIKPVEPEEVERKIEEE